MIAAAEVHILLAYADQARGRALVRGLAVGGLSVAERAIDAAGLLAAARAAAGSPDGPRAVALVDSRLPGLDRGVVEALDTLRVGVVLVGSPTDPSLDGATLVAPEGEPAAIAEAVRRAGIGVVRRNGHAPRGDPGDRPRRDRGNVVCVTSGKGGPGKTTIATTLAAALVEGGAEARTRVALADLDLHGGNISLALRLEPRFNLFQVASALGAGHDLAAAVGAELQEVRPRLRVLGGLAAPGAMLADVTPGLVERVLRQLAADHTWVVADLGSAAELTGLAGVGHRAALEAADLVLVVAEPNPLGLWNLRLALADGGPLAPFRGKAGVVLNRFHPRHHHAPGEVAAEFPEVPVLACVEHEYECTEQALREQRPLVEDRHSQAAAAIRRLAGNLLAAIPAAGASGGVPREQTA